MRGKNQELAPQVIAGDIGVVTKLNVTGTGDTLCTRDKPVKLAPIVFPNPIYSGAVSPKSKADLDKLGSSLTRLAEEDPTIKVQRDLDTGETVLSGLGETQLEVVVGKMQRKFGVGVTLSFRKCPTKKPLPLLQREITNTKNRPVDTASTDMSCWKLNPCPAAPALNLWMSLSAELFPATFFPPLKKALRMLSTKV